MATYVISDLHGQFDLFLKLLLDIAFSDNDYMYVIGDAIDRGPYGIKILQYIKDTPNMDLLIGNHENLMLYSIDLDGDINGILGIDAGLWFLGNGGFETYEEYKLLPNEERINLIEWLGTRLFTKLIEVNETTFCLTHSFFKMDRINETWAQMDYKTSMEITWMSPFREDEYVPISDYSKYPYQFVIRHVPVQRITKEDRLKEYSQENVTVIDGGCAYRN